MSDFDVYKPIEKIGYLLSMFGSLGFLVEFSLLRGVEYIVIVWSFISVLSAYHLSIGIGLIYRKRFWLKNFKIYLSIIYLAFPLGTMFSRYAKRYIEENNIDRFTK